MLDASVVWVLIPLAAIVMWGAKGIAQALAAGRARSTPAVLPDDGLRAEVEDLRQRVMELEERQDFTDRVLTRGRGEGMDHGS
jgi:hypothetical protein